MEKELRIIHITHACTTPVTETDQRRVSTSKGSVQIRKEDYIRKRNNEASKTYRANKRNKINCMHDELRDLKDRNNKLQNEVSLLEMQVNSMKKLVHEKYT